MIYGIGLVNYLVYIPQFICEVTLCVNPHSTDAILFHDVN